MPFVGYQGGGSLTVDGGRLYIDQAVVYGAMVDVALEPHRSVELLYSRQEPALRFDPRSGGPSRRLLDAVLEYYQLGGMVESSRRGTVRPILGATIGAARLDARSPGAGDSWKWARTLGAVVKIALGERFLARLQTRGSVALYHASSSLFCYLPGYCNVAVRI
ncbi:MAG: hypothetical protein ACJ79S_16330 [Gemmatimonadaceae bacterium]